LLSEVPLNSQGRFEAYAIGAGAMELDHDTATIAKPEPEDGPDADRHELLLLGGRAELARAEGLDLAAVDSIDPQSYGSV
jgi:hypothetical protein